MYEGYFIACFLLCAKLVTCRCAVLLSKVSVGFLLTGSIVTEVSTLPLNGSAER